MIRYICRHCNNYECETSICPICGERTELVSTDIYYCDKCNVPVFYEDCPDCGEKCKRIGSDIRPVFAQERLLLEILLKKPMAFAGHSVWSTNSTTYWVDGVCKKISLTKARQQNPDEIAAILDKYKEENQKYVQEDLTNEHIQRFIYVNRYRLNAITDEAVTYIKNIAKGFDQSSVFCSFSGGKDSTVTSSLVMRALDIDRQIN